MKRKLIALTLLLCMLLSLFVGCSEELSYSYDLDGIVSLESGGKKIYLEIPVYTDDIEEKMKEALDEILYLEENTTKFEQKDKENPSANEAILDRDKVNIDYKGTALGKTLTDYTYTPASSKELPLDLKDKLVGLEIGKGSKEAPVLAAWETTLPSDLKNSNGAASEFSGKAVSVVVYKITKITYNEKVTKDGKEVEEERILDKDGDKVPETYTSVVLDMAYTFKSSKSLSGYEYKTDDKTLPTDLQTKLKGIEFGTENANKKPSLLTYETTLPADLKDGDKTSELAGKAVTVIVYKISKVTYTKAGETTPSEMTSGTIPDNFASATLNMIYICKDVADPVAFNGGSTYTGTKKDEAGKELTNQPVGSDLIIGSDSFVDDFEQQLIGHKLGEKLTVSVTFPASYPSNTLLENMDAEFETTINYLHRPIAEPTDAMIKKFCEDQRNKNYSNNKTDTGRIYETTKEYKEDLRKSIIKSMVYDQLIDERKPTILAWNKVPELREAYDGIWDQIDYYYATNVGSALTYNEFLTSFYCWYSLFGLQSQSSVTDDGFKYDVSTPEGVSAYVYYLAKKNVLPHLALHAIAQQENIELTDAEYEAGVNRLFEEEYKGKTYPDKDDFLDAYSEDTLRVWLLEEEVYDWLLEHGIKEEATNPENEEKDSANKESSDSESGDKTNG